MHIISICVGWWLIMFTTAYGNGSVSQVGDLTLEVDITDPIFWSNQVVGCAYHFDQVASLYIQDASEWVLGELLQQEPRGLWLYCCLRWTIQHENQIVFSPQQCVDKRFGIYLIWILDFEIPMNKNENIWGSNLTRNKNIEAWPKSYWFLKRGRIYVRVFCQSILVVLVIVWIITHKTFELISNKNSNLNRII